MAKYRIEIKKSAAKEISNLPAKYLKKVLNRIDKLSTNPRPIGSVKLSGKEKYRIRVGIYRILYQIFEEKLVVIVVKVAHRKDVYKR